MRTRFIDGIAAIAAHEWNTVTGTDYPFIRHEFLLALESSGSVCAKRGWQATHLLVEGDDGAELIAVLPFYIKTHSFGEYVFDHSWADAYSRHGLNYYPKLLSAIPFTPASGPRLCYNEHIVVNRERSAALMVTVAEALRQKCAAIGASGWHVLFPEKTTLPLWRQTETDIRLGCQYHWFNDGYQSFDDFLATFNARRRKELKRERRKVAEQGVRLERLTGAQITDEIWQQFYRFYQITNLKYNRHGGYLTPEFFTELHQTMAEQMLLVMVYRADESTGRSENAIAGALNFFSSDTLYGRYWGAIDEVEFLHFEACYYQGIEFCIERSLQRFDPGAQGEHKISRGFRPVLTYSQHWLANPRFRAAVHDFLAKEGPAIERYREQACEGLPFKDGGLSPES